MTALPEPVSRQDKLLHNIADETPSIEDLVPNCREEVYLKYIAINGTAKKEIPLKIEHGDTEAINSGQARENLGIYSKSEVNTMVSELSESYYNKTQTDNLLNLKANKSDLSQVATSGSKTALIGLLREIIDIPEEEYAHIEIIDPNLRVNKSYGKSGILDIKLTTKNGQRINIEIQIRKASDLKQRILFYASKMIAEQLTEGEKYDKIRKVISIMICTDHNLIEDSKEYHNRYFLYDKNTNSTFTDLLEIDILEFKKVPEKDKSNLATWLRFLNTDDKEELDKMDHVLKQLKCTKF